MSGIEQKFLSAARQLDDEIHAFEKSPEKFRHAFTITEKLDIIARLIYLLRAKKNKKDDQFMVKAEDYLSTQFQLLGQLAGAKASTSEISFYLHYRLLWRKYFDVFYFTLFIFVGATLMGIGFGLNHSEYVVVVSGPEIMEKILDHEAWFERLQRNPLMGAFSIMVNNIKVGILCFLGGSLLGLGGWFILFYNGLMFGMIFGYCYKNGFADRLGDFVLAHGFLELTIIIASAFASFLIGQTFWQGPVKKLRERIKIRTKEGLILMMGALPWLILAGLIEGFISPYPVIDSQVKVFIGLLVTVLFWLFTFWPLPKSINAQNF